MTPQEEVQSLLRFLTRDARIPLADALPKINELRKYGTVENIAKADPSELVPIFPDEKAAKVIVNAAKRVSSPKKRSAPVAARSNKRVKIEEGQNDEELEATLALPETDASAEDLRTVVIETNRAPLYLAYAVQVLKYIHPEQPLSSRLSLAQAAMSQGAQSKARAIGLTNGPTAAEDGFLQGQPRMKVMGQQIAVMRRARDSTRSSEETLKKVKHEDEQISLDGSQLKIEYGMKLSTQHDAFWGIDIEALRKSNGPLIAGKNAIGRPIGPPIHPPEAARGYMLRSISPSKSTEEMTNEAGKSDKAASGKKPSAAEVSQKKEQAAGMLLKAIDIVCKSWADVLSAEELNRRAGNWYAITRPEVNQGQAGWGQRGLVCLNDILKLQRDPHSHDPVVKAAQSI